MTISELLRLYLQSQEFMIKESSYSIYEFRICYMIDPYIGDADIETVNLDFFQDYVIKLSTTKRVSGELYAMKSTKGCMILLRSAFQFAYEKGYISEKKDFGVRYPKRIENPKALFFTDYEVRKLMDYCINHPNHNTLGILIALNTGMRIGELAALKWSDIDFNSNIINVNKTMCRIRDHNSEEYSTKLVISTPKTATSIRQIPINSHLLADLKRFKGRPTQYVLSGRKTPREPQNFRFWYKRLLKKLELPNLRLHCLRHTFASRAILNGIDAKTLSEILGHSDVQTTLRLYVHSSFKQKEKAVFIMGNDLYNNKNAPKE